MSLFNQILSAINNPQQEASDNQISNILNTVQQLSNDSQASPSAVQSALSIVGNYTRSSLQEKRNQGGEGQVQSLINQFGGLNPSTQVLQSLFTTSQIQQIIQEVKSKTGIETSAIQSMLPMLVPMVLNFLKTGNSPGGGNSVLNSFLDADGDGDVDLADAMQMASRYLQK